MFSFYQNIFLPEGVMFKEVRSLVSLVSPVVVDAEICAMGQDLKKDLITARFVVHQMSFPQPHACTTDVIQNCTKVKRSSSVTHEMCCESNCERRDA